MHADLLADPLWSDLYARKSTTDAGRSVERQERQWRADCTREGIQQGRVFAAPDISASRFSTKERPDCNELLDHIRSGACQMVAMWEASRGSRDLREWLDFLALCRKHHVLIRVFSDGGQTYDVRRRRDWKELAKEGLEADDESWRLSERVRAGTVDAATEGRPPGPLLYGYLRQYGAPTDDSTTAAGKKRREVRQVIHPEHAAIVRKLADDALAGRPLERMARELERRGVAPPGRGRWRGGQITRLRRNPGYVGDRIYKGEVGARGAWEAILTREQHDRLCALLGQPKRRWSEDSTLRHLLSGAAHCGVCRAPMRVHKRTRYACVARGCHKVTCDRESVERDVEEIVQAKLNVPGWRAALFPPQDGAKAAAAHRELKDLKDHLRGFYDLAAQKKLPPVALAEVEVRMRPQIRAAEARLRKLETPPALDEFRNIDVPARFPGFPVAMKRRFILAVADVVVSATGKGGRWGLYRLAESRWHGDDMTWGEHWAAGS